MCIRDSEYTTLLNGMSADVKFGDLEKLASTAGVKEVYLANYYDEPVEMCIRDRRVLVPLSGRYLPPAGRHAGPPSERQVQCPAL